MKSSASGRKQLLNRSRYPFQMVFAAVLALGVAAGSIWYMQPARGMVCHTLTPLTVLATIAAFLMSICFRLMSRFKQKVQRWFLFFCLLIAGATLFSDFRYVRHYRDMCDQMGPQLQQLR